MSRLIPEDVLHCIRNSLPPHPHRTMHHRVAALQAEIFAEADLLIQEDVSVDEMLWPSTAFFWFKAAQNYYTTPLYYSTTALPH